MTDHVGHRDPNQVADALSAYWDTLVGGDAADDTRAPEGLVALVDRLHTADTAPALVPEQRTAIWQEVMTTHVRDTEAHRIVADELLSANGNSPGLPLPQPTTTPQWSRLSARPGWIVAQLATAALLLVTLIGSFLVFGPGRPGQQLFAPAVIPAISATPATPETDGVTTKPLLDVIIATIGADQAWVQIDRFTMPPATAMEVDVRGGRIPEVFYIAEGAIELRAGDTPEPVRVIRAGGAGKDEELPSRESATLIAGDGFIIPEGGAADLMNMTAEPAIGLLLLVPRSIDLPGTTGIKYETLVGNMRNVSAPLALTLRQVTLAPDASIPGVEAPNVEQVAIPVDSDRVMDARTSSDGSLRNAGDEPLEAYVLTVTSDAPGALAGVVEHATTSTEACAS